MIVESAQKTYHITEVANTNRAEYTPKNIMPCSVSHLFEVGKVVVPKKKASHRTDTIGMVSLETSAAWLVLTMESANQGE
jgi:hypothetical protein